MTIPATMERPLRASLHELCLGSEDPERLAHFYAGAMGYGFVPGGGDLLGTGPDRRLAIRRGAPRSLAYAAYAVPDAEELAALERRLARASVEHARIDMAGFVPGAVAFRDPDGNEFRFGIATDAAKAAGPDTLPARLQHVVFASTDVTRMLVFFTEVVGFVLSDIVEDEKGGLRTFFVRCSHEHHSLAVFAADENRLDHHCYETVEWNLIRDWADHFARQHIKLKWGPGRHGPGDNLFLFIHDPDGNWVEISAELEHVAPDRPVGSWPHEERTLNSWGIGLLRS